jgi:C1A family cysteine protease
LKTIIIAILCLSVVLADESVIFKKFTEFVSKFDKQYTSIEEFTMRYTNFKSSLMKVFAADDFSGEHTVSITKFSDMSEEEFSTKMLTLKTEPNGWCSQVKLAHSNKAVPDQKDWKAEGKVTDIKDQGSCGSCWAFSAVAFLESQNLIKTGKTATYSEQQLVDCDKGTDQGCNGGLMHTALKYFASKGAEDDKRYPYTARGGVCAYNAAFVIAKVSNVKCVENATVDQMKQMINDVGPLSIAVAANDFQTYGKGVLTCRYAGLNHGVLLVGYGTEGTTPYWIVKNSWGKNWGETGFVRVSQAAGKNCGIGAYIATADIQ